MSTITFDMTGSDSRDDIGMVLDAYKGLSLMAGETNPCAAVSAKDVADVLFVLNQVLEAVLTPQM